MPDNSCGTSHAGPIKREISLERTSVNWKNNENPQISAGCLQCTDTVEGWVLMEAQPLTRSIEKGPAAQSLTEYQRELNPRPR